MAYKYPVRFKNTIDTTSTSNADSIILGRAAVVEVDKSFVVVSTALVSSAAVVLDLLDGSTVIGQATLTATQAVHSQVFFVTASGISPNYVVASGANLKVKVSTASAGGGAAGVVHAYVAMDQGES